MGSGDTARVSKHRERVLYASTFASPSDSEEAAFVRYVARRFDIMYLVTIARLPGTRLAPAAERHDAVETEYADLDNLRTALWTRPVGEYARIANVDLIVRPVHTRASVEEALRRSRLDQHLYRVNSLLIPFANLAGLPAGGASGVR